MIQIIKLADGLELETEIREDQVREISSQKIASSTMEKIKPLLNTVIQPISEVYSELSKDMIIESSKVSIGIKVGLEGNFFVAKSAAEANIQIEMTLRPAK